MIRWLVSFFVLLLLSGCLEVEYTCDEYACHIRVIVPEALHPGQQSELDSPQTWRLHLHAYEQTRVVLFGGDYILRGPAAFTHLDTRILSWRLT